MWTAALSTVGVVGSIIWIAYLVAARRNQSQIQNLADLPDMEPPGGWPSLALVFAARDEERVVEQAARSMLALNYPALELIAVDDRSRDETGAILDKLAASDPRLSVIHVAELPAGWLGKTHALQAAANETDAEWVLFTDADVVFAPNALRRAVAAAVAGGVAHMTVSPEVPTETLGERVFLSMFLTGLAFHSPGWLVQDPRSRAYLGIGAFNLVRAADFRAIGGFGRLKLSVDDDMQLGRAMKWSGRKSRVVLGARAVSVRWQVGLDGMIRGLEKNYFAGARFQLWRMLVFQAAIILVGIAMFAGLLVGPVWCRLICGVGVAALSIMLEVMGRPCGVRWYHAAFMPVASLVNMYALFRSTWHTLRRGGVTWRGHLYSLKELRDHVSMREIWMKQLWSSTR